jgi:hypothetical protein
LVEAFADAFNLDTETAKQLISKNFTDFSVFSNYNTTNTNTTVINDY